MRNLRTLFGRIPLLGRLFGSSSSPAIVTAPELDKAMREYGETIVERVDNYLQNLLRPRLEMAGELGIDIANEIHVSQIDVYVDTTTYTQEQYPEPRNELDKIGLDATQFLRKILTQEYGVPEAEANLVAVRQISLIFGVKHSPWCRFDKFSLSTGQYVGSCYRVCNSCV